VTGEKARMKMRAEALTLLLLFVLALTLNSEMSTVNWTVPAASAESPEVNTVRYGVTYLSTHYHYEPHYLSDETLDRDFSLFRKQGLKYITLAAVWKYLEPQLGVYNDAAIDELIRVCNFASKYDLSVIVEFYTMMQQDSFTMPEWLSPRKFEAVFTSETFRQAWLSFLDHCASRLNSSESIWSWHMMNEPARREWACNVSTEDFLELWTEMRAVFKSYSDRQVAIRFAAQVFDSPLHFNRDSRIYEVCDYMALNWYENETRNCTRQLLESLIPEIRQHTQVMISEFGLDTAAWNCTDQDQADKYSEYLALFKELGINDIIAWMWRADYNSPNPQPPGAGFNLAKNVEGEPRPAFYLMDVVPPVICIQTPENKKYITSYVALTLSIDKRTSWIGYSLDDHTNVTINDNTTIVGLPDGLHVIVAFANDTVGNMGVSNSVFFTIDTSFFSDDFESGGFNAWNGIRNSRGETGVVVNWPSYQDDYRARFMSNGGGGTEYSYIYKTVASSTDLYARGYFCISKSGIAYNNDNFYLLAFRAGSNNVAYAGWGKVGGNVRWCLMIKSGTKNAIAYSTQIPAVNQWYCVELHWKKDVANGMGELWINGTRVCSMNGKNTASFGNVSQVHFGLPQLYHCKTTTAYCDACKISRSRIGT